MGMKDLAEDLKARRQRALAMGGAEAIAKQHGEGKLTVRERVERLFDPESFHEIGLLATHANISPAMKGKETPADGVVTGFGKINGRPASLIAYDFTVMAGSMGPTAEVKCNRAREIALSKRMPMIWLIDSAGARIQEAIGSTFAGSGFLFREESIMSGVVPMVAAMMGPGAAGTAYIPALSDFVPIVKGTRHMSLGGPPPPASRRSRSTCPIPPAPPWSGRRSWRAMTRRTAWTKRSCPSCPTARGAPMT